jgi:hypothetical protein
LRTMLGGRPMVTRISARTASRGRNYDGSRAAMLLGMRMRTADEAVRNVAAFLQRN